MKKIVYFGAICSVLLLLASCSFSNESNVDGYIIEKVDGGYALCELSEEAKLQTEFTIPTKIGKYKIVQFGSNTKHMMGSELYELDFGNIRKLNIPSEIKTVDQNIDIPLLIKTEEPITSINGLAYNTNGLQYFYSPKENLDVNYVDSSNCKDGIIFEDKEDGTAKILYSYVNDFTIPDYIDNLFINEISAYAFYNADNITISDNISIIGENAFELSGDVFISSNNNVKEIKNNAFNYSGIKEFPFSNTLEIIDYGAFAYSSLEEAILPSSLKELGAYAFYSTKNLKRLIMNDSSVVEIPKSCFSMSNLSDYVGLPHNLTKICSYAFSETSAKSFSLPSSITMIESSAFIYNSELLEFILPDKYVLVESDFIGKCDKLETLDLGGASSFNIVSPSLNSFPGLREIIVAENNGYLKVVAGMLLNNNNKILKCPALLNIREIMITGEEPSKYAFKDNIYLEKVYYNAQSLSIGLFENCTSLKEVKLSVDLEIIPDKCFSGCTNLEDINLRYIKSIGNSAFKYNKKLDIINLDNCEIIGDYAFADCVLEGVSFSDKINSIGYYAFYNNPNLTTCDVKNAAYSNQTFLNTPLYDQYYKD